MHTYTADDLTDDQIKQMREELLRESDGQFTNDTDACGMALSEHPNPDFRAWQRTVGRVRVAELLNMREKDKEIARLRALIERAIDACEAGGRRDDMFAEMDRIREEAGL